jgi:deoxyribonuclease-4
MIWFGPAGNSESFETMGYKKMEQVPEYLEKMGLNAYEYQCGRGVRLRQDAAAKLKILFAQKNIRVSLHAPYFISLSSVEAEKRDNSIQYILDSAKAVDWPGGDRIVVHSGSCSKMSREEATALAKETLQKAQRTLDENGLSHIHICPETMGKINQLGTLEEVMELCSVDERFIPCIDFGHLNARTLGGLTTEEALRQVFDTVETRLGTERMRSFHSHFSKIQYTAGGEKCHLTFADTQYGPNFDPVAKLVEEKKCEPVFICESAGTQAEDSLTMKRVYQSYL